jgi:hypothetical protein
MAQVYCRLGDNIVADIISIPDGADIADRFTPKIVEALVPGDDTVKIGMFWDGEHFGGPPPPVPPPPPRPTFEDLIAALIRKNVIALSDTTS